MGKFVEDYDAQLNPHRWGYQKSKGKGDWIDCAHELDLLNCCISERFRIADLPAPPVVMMSLKDEYGKVQEARAYCYKYMREVEKAITRERDQLKKQWSS